jgi:hypothetical protein
VWSEPQHASVGSSRGDHGAVGSWRAASLTTYIQTPLPLRHRHHPTAHTHTLAHMRTQARQTLKPPTHPRRHRTCRLR